MLRCIVIDDEPLALDILEDYISKVPFLQLVAATTDVIGALQMVQEQKADLVFLDMQMPELSGLQFMKIAAGKCAFILTTAYSEYALEGYEHNVVDYLLKPIPFERFYKAAEKAHSIPPKNAPEPAASHPFIFVKTDGKIVKVMLDDLLFVEGLKDYIILHTAKEKIITLQNLRNMEEGLPGERFVRVHKSFIIALDKIDSIERNRIFIGNAVIPVGVTHQKMFFDLVESRNFHK
ncbi:LytTR family DNA-binding domain-containing protein [Ferruginibacter sp. HRS2-29]|uniref:LytR/AlgR family response regulator transcription factor n=1 Tax=Ferruginibacter sp. HRS2-29 TaxID=2487334 RepID=UPI0020CDCB07|nr:LytTR family DNA-binding domain-containing protein [Ferruginibacter sp. HRS2-29]MCP9752166.1 DNA-binding response regulator [Ferruginibacter sp. HRS2-29]